MAKSVSSDNIYNAVAGFTNKYKELNSDSSNNSKTMVRIEDLVSFKNHPFKVIDNEDMDDLVTSIKTHGVINPIIVRPTENSKYEILSGHRRAHASTLCDIKEIPAYIINLSDDEAILYMVDSNIQRTSLLPSEIAKSYKMKMDAMNRQGQKSKNSDEKVDSAKEIADEAGISKSKVFRYIRLTELTDDLLNLVDANVISVTSTAQSLSYLSKEAQNIIFNLYSSCHKLPSSGQAASIRKYEENGNLITEDYLKSVYVDVTKPEKEVLNIKKCMEYFPKGTSFKEMEETIFMLLDNFSSTWKNKEM